MYPGFSPETYGIAQASKFRNWSNRSSGESVLSVLVDLQQDWHVTWGDMSGGVLMVGVWDFEGRQWSERDYADGIYLSEIILINIHMCMYVCMYLFQLVSMYVCMYVCIYLSIYPSIYFNLFLCMHVCMHFRLFISDYWLIIYLSIYLCLLHSFTFSITTLLFPTFYVRVAI